MVEGVESLNMQCWRFKSRNFPLVAFETIIPDQVSDTGVGNKICKCQQLKNLKFVVDFMYTS
jgi:hypothetical protein